MVERIRILDDIDKAKVEILRLKTKLAETQIRLEKLERLFKKVR